MKAVILAAGFGERLKPLTLKRPKTLMPVGNRPVINRIMHYLKKNGINEITVTAHHHPRQLVSYLANGGPFGITLQVRVESKILGTGGGIKNVENLLGTDPFIVINGDILTNIDLSYAFEAHRKKRNLATLILHDCKPFNQIQIDQHFNVLDIAGDEKPGRLAFTGIHIIEPELLTYIVPGIFSNIIDCYRHLIKLGKPVGAYVSKGHYWRDIGTVESYILANKEILEGKAFLQDSGCRIHNSAKLKDWAIIGKTAHIEEGVEIRRSILWENVKVKRGTKVIDSIITSSGELDCDLIGGIL